jgi:hypothetical protein
MSTVGGGGGVGGGGSGSLESIVNDIIQRLGHLDIAFESAELLRVAAERKKHGLASSFSLAHS